MQASAVITHKAVGFGAKLVINNSSDWGQKIWFVMNLDSRSDLEISIKNLRRNAFSSFNRNIINSMLLCYLCHLLLIYFTYLVQ